MFNNSLQGLWMDVARFVPNLISAIVLFVVGWVLGSYIAKALEQVVSALKVDKLLATVGAEDLLRKAGMNLNSGYFLGQVVKWFIVVLFLLPSLSLVGLGDVSSVLKESVLAYLPSIFVAAFVLIIAAIVSEALSRAVTAGVKSMGFSSSSMYGSVVKYAVWVFAVAAALIQLHVAEDILLNFFGVFMNTLGISLALAFGLAFGLGGKDAAARYIAKLENEVSNRS